MNYPFIRDLPEKSIAARMQRWVLDLQERICRTLEEMDGIATFSRDVWERSAGGGGLTRVIEGEALFEKGGVNSSVVWGILPERMAQAFGVETEPFFATGLSLVLHPRSPHVPTVHANFRYFALGENIVQPRDAWFGGGADLTPIYPHLEDVQHFHRIWYAVCARHPEVADYARFKEWCDQYFFLPHRNEARGVGGIFFDYLREQPEQTFAFVQEAGEHFLPAYLPIVERRRHLPFTERERQFQEIRRGRYVEFNLIYDRGTRFGLETGGRTESILMSLPPRAQWHYNWQPEPGSPEEKATWFFQARDWFNICKNGN